MATRLFASNGRFRLFCNDEWVSVPMRHRHDIVDWCRRNGVVFREHRNNIAIRHFDISLWEIGDAEQRMLFRMVWGSCG